MKITRKNVCKEKGFNSSVVRGRMTAASLVSETSLGYSQAQIMRHLKMWMKNWREPYMQKLTRSCRPVSTVGTILTFTELVSSSSPPWESSPTMIMTRWRLKSRSRATKAWPLIWKLQARTTLPRRLRPSTIWWATKLSWTNICQLTSTLFRTA